MKNLKNFFVKSISILSVGLLLAVMATPQEVTAQNPPGKKLKWNQNGGCSNCACDCTIGDPIGDQ
jgi:hypothetical protein